MKMRFCTGCSKNVPLSSFLSNGFTPKGTKKYKPRCTICVGKKQRSTFRERLKEFYGELACQSCGYNKSIAALECHHRDPNEKDKQISRMTTASKQKLFAELKKCDLLCANCHREEHERLRAQQ